MKKRILTLLLCLALCPALLPARAGAAFTDIEDETTALAAAALQGLGVISGTGGDAFDPDTVLTRAQLCTMAVNALGLDGQVSAHARKTLFSDVASSSWYNGYINLAYSQGLVNGYGDGTFGPDDPVTYGQTASILLRMLEYTSSEIGSVWPLDYTAFADNLDLSEGLSLDAYDTVTRGEAAVLLYRTLKASVNGGDTPLYETLSGVASTQEAILLDADSSYGSSDGLLMAYALEGEGVTYYTQENSQSDGLEGSLGELLLDSSGRVLGFIPQEGGWEDVTVDSASASGFTGADGVSRRASSDTVVVSAGTAYPYTTTGYLQLDAWSGKSVRLYYDDAGAILCIYLAGGTVTSSQAAVASSASASSIARQLGVSDKSYAVTKNGAAAASSDVAQYDVGYYDAASNTLRVSDYRVSGYLSSAQPNTAAPTTLTVAGCTFDVLESAWDSLEDVSLSGRITMLLTDDLKVAAVYPASTLSAEMVGVLSEDGASVTLADSGVTLTASTMSYSESALGSLVTVSASSASALRCTPVSENASSSLDLTSGTLGGLELAPACSIYEWAGSGYVYDLEGGQGGASDDFDAIFWTDTVPASSVSYYHTNASGQVDVLLLKNVTGNSYAYGRIRLYTGESGINLGSGDMSAYNTAAVLTNAEGSSQRYLCAISTSSNAYVGISLSGSSSGYTRVSAVRTLSKVSGADEDGFFQSGDDWYLEVGGTELPVSSQVQIHLTETDTWLSGGDGLAAVLAGDFTLTVYADQDASGRQVRIILAD